VPHNSPRARGAVAELERSLIVERMKAGLRNTRAKGKHLGRTKRVVDARRIDELRAQGAGSPVNEWLIIFKTRRSQPAGTFLRSRLRYRGMQTCREAMTLAAVGFRERQT
jgi:DNA invertase Pin-like site-specific DNA recombinase